MNQNRKKPKKESGHEELLAKLVFITAILNLIQAVVDLIKEFSSEQGSESSLILSLIYIRETIMSI